MAVTWLEADALIPTATARLLQSKIVLDIGCGIQPQRLVRPEVHICCEPFMQYVERLQELVRLEPDRNFVVLNATWDQAVQVFPPKSVDTVILHDVIEHLEKEDALRLLQATEPLARRQIVVFTPLGFMPQHHPDGKDAWGLDGGHWQEHRSGWQPEDFDDSWDLFVTKVFHLTDVHGNVLETPFGALWAIKTFPEALTGPMLQVSNRQRVYAAVDKVLNVIWKIKDLLKGRG
jgi:hypothetical protein